MQERRYAVYLNGKLLVLKVIRLTHGFLYKHKSKINEIIFF